MTAFVGDQEEEVARTYNSSPATNLAADEEFMSCVLATRLGFVPSSITDNPVLDPGAAPASPEFL
jgi:hypothetical protein